MKVILSYRMMATLCVVLAITLLQSFGASSAYVSPALSPTNVDISNEGQTLDSFVTDLSQLDKKCVEFSKKSTLTRAELEPLQRVGDGLRNRLSGVQNALREIIRKLKAAGQWDDLDARVLATITDSNARNRLRENSFKRELENLASQLTSHANEISSPVDILRSKLKAQLPDPRNDREFESRAVRVAYNPASPMFTFSFRCRLAFVRHGISGFIHGKPTREANINVNCQCGNPTGCIAQ